MKKTNHYTGRHSRKKFALPAVAGLACVIFAAQALGEAVPQSTITHRSAGGIDPKPYIESIELTTNGLQFEWSGFGGPYTVFTSDNIAAQEWQSFETNGTAALLAAEYQKQFVKISGPSPVFAGAATCMQCHSDTHTEWSETSHAGALETLKAIGQGENGQCLPCHTVGYGLPTGYKNETETPYFAGVQCENCHGPGGEHAMNPGDESNKPLIEMSSMMCGGCHTDTHHPTYDEWELSSHSDALSTIQNHPFGGDSCLECHSQDYRYAEEAGYDMPSVENAQLSLECSTCHAPHGGVEHEGLLRAEVGNLCGQCHTQEEATLGDSPHHPQFEMLKGIGAFNSDGTPLEQTSAHSQLAAAGGQACAQCHVVSFEVENPNQGNPNVTGHTFNPFDESITTHQAPQYAGCSDCHTSEWADQHRHELQSEVENRLAALAPYFNEDSEQYIDPAQLSAADQEKLQIAEFNYHYVEADGSLGVHNKNNASEALDVADTIVGELQ
ncbi:MAG: cytochrome c3 family protein [Verrucomicrobia bacterium]|nr:cytochrome c3 family protein [Verrucomicrobiota bacterium]MCF7708081.1 cytochrome c3 family protein [Verrucomicrobiota bacterium]